MKESVANVVVWMIKCTFVIWRFGSRSFRAERGSASGFLFFVVVCHTQHSGGRQTGKQAGNSQAGSRQAPCGVAQRHGAPLLRRPFTSTTLSTWPYLATHGLSPHCIKNIYIIRGRAVVFSLTNLPLKTSLSNIKPLEVSSCPT